MFIQFLLFASKVGSVSQILSQLHPIQQQMLTTFESLCIFLRCTVTWRGFFAIMGSKRNVSSIFILKMLSDESFHRYCVLFFIPSLRNIPRFMNVSDSLETTNRTSAPECRVFFK